MKKKVKYVYSYGMLFNRERFFEGQTPLGGGNQIIIQGFKYVSVLVTIKASGIAAHYVLVIIQMEIFPKFLLINNF